MPGATLKQIAEHAGVSIQTVSCILRGISDAYSPDTCEKVLRIARELDYRPSMLSRALLGKKSMTLGLVMGGLGGSVAAHRMGGFIQAAREQGYLVYVVNTAVARPGDNDKCFMETIRELLARRVDGLVVYRGTPLSVAARRFIDAASIPTVFIDWGPPRSARRIVLDREPAIRRVAEHLAALGHREATFLPSKDSFDFREHRILPYRRAFAKAGVALRVDRRWAVEPLDDTARSAFEITGALLAEPHGRRLTALLLTDDAAAQGAIAAIRAAGLDVPGDVSVVGYGDSSTSGFSDPSLTTIKMPDENVGQAAFEMLGRLLADPAVETKRRMMPLQLVVRDSTGPARSMAVANEASVDSTP